MAKRVSIKIELVMTGYDDQVDFIKDTLTEDLQSKIDYVFEVENVDDKEIDDFCHEMQHESNCSYWEIGACNCQ